MATLENSTSLSCNTAGRLLLFPARTLLRRESLATLFGAVVIGGIASYLSPNFSHYTQVLLRHRAVSWVGGGLAASTLLGLLLKRLGMNQSRMAAPPQPASIEQDRAKNAKRIAEIQSRIPQSCKKTYNTTVSLGIAFDTDKDPHYPALLRIFQKEWLALSIILSQGIEQHPLHLDNAELTDAQIHEFVQALRHNSNEVVPEAAFSYTSNFMLANNPGITDQSAQDIASIILRSKVPQWLSLSGTSYAWNGIKDLLTSIAKGKPGLETLIIAHKSLGAPPVEMWEELVQQMRAAGVKRIEISGIDSQEMCDFVCYLSVHWSQQELVRITLAECKIPKIPAAFRQQLESSLAANECKLQIDGNGHPIIPSRWLTND